MEKVLLGYYYSEYDKPLEIIKNIKIVDLKKNSLRQKNN